MPKQKLFIIRIMSLTQKLTIDIRWRNIEKTRIKNKKNKKIEEIDRFEYLLLLNDVFEYLCAMIIIILVSSISTTVRGAKV